ncbi:MAG TPA: type II secretion system protein [Candidatus Paceibacterota bacterium]
MNNKINKQNNFSKLQAKSYKLVAAFSLIELIVAVSIMILITSVVLFRQAKFSSDILISNMAYAVALSIREAEVLGISSRGSSAGSPTPFKVGYGVHFNPFLANDNPNSFLSFVAQPVSGTDGPGEDTEFYFTYTKSSLEAPSSIYLNQGQKIRDYCVHSSTSGEWKCWSDQSDLAMNIVFIKPNPDAHITIGTAVGSDINNYSLFYENPDSYDAATILVESALGDKCRTISVSVSGQIGVDSINPANPSGCPAE